MHWCLGLKIREQFTVSVFSLTVCMTNLITHIEFDKCLTQEPMGNSHKNLVWNQLLKWNQTLIKQSLDGPLPKLCLVVPPSDQYGCTAELSLTQDPMGNSHKNHLIWNQQLNQNQTWMEQSLDGPLPKLCPTVTLSHQDGRHSAVALVLKAALIQVSDYRLLGASGFFSQSFGSNDDAVTCHV